MSPDALKAHIESVLRTHAERKRACFVALRDKELGRRRPNTMRAEVYAALVDKWEDWIARKAHRVAECATQRLKPRMD